MGGMGPGWKANFVYDPFGRDGKLYLYQHVLGGATNVVTDLGRNGTSVERVAEGVHLGEGIRVPYELLQAIADMVNPPDVESEGVVKQLRADLEHERGRVDQILSRLVP
jgi:hypothetical protein